MSAALVIASGTPRSTFTDGLEDVAPSPADGPDAAPEPRASALQTARMYERRIQETEARMAEYLRRQQALAANRSQPIYRPAGPSLHAILSDGEEDSAVEESAPSLGHQGVSTFVVSQF